MRRRVGIIVNLNGLERVSVAARRSDHTGTESRITTESELSPTFNSPSVFDPVSPDNPDAISAVCASNLQTGRDSDPPSSSLFYVHHSTLLGDSGQR